MTATENPKKRRDHKTFHLKPELRKKVKDYSWYARMTQKQVVEEALEEYFLKRPFEGEAPKNWHRTNKSSE